MALLFQYNLKLNKIHAAGIAALSEPPDPEPTEVNPITELIAGSRSASTSFHGHFSLDRAKADSRSQMHEILCGSDTYPLSKLKNENTEDPKM